MTDAEADRERRAADAARRERLDELLNDRVAPKLAELRAKQRRYRGWALFSGVGGPVLGGLCLAVGDPWAIFLGLSALVFGPGHAAYVARRYHQAARAVVTPVVCEAIGGITHEENVRSGDVHRLRRAKLVTPFSSAEIDDVFQGSHDGIAFVMMELHLQRVTRTASSRGRRGRSTRTHTIFRGLMFMIAIPRRIPVPILMRGRPRWFGTPWRLADGQLEGMQRIDIPDEAFARHLSLWTTDPAQAAQVITPPLAAVMARLAASAGRRGIDAAFDFDQFLLLLPRRGDQFRVGGLFRSVRRLRADAHRLLDEILTVHRLIETLKGS